jgi:hypothetical protein
MFLSCLGKVGTISLLRFILVVFMKDLLKTHNLSQIKIVHKGDLVRGEKTKDWKKDGRPKLGNNG